MFNTPRNKASNPCLSRFTWITAWRRSFLLCNSNRFPSNSKYNDRCKRCSRIGSGRGPASVARSWMLYPAPFSSNGTQPPDKIKTVHAPTTTSTHITPNASRDKPVDPSPVYWILKHCVIALAHVALALRGERQEAPHAWPVSARGGAAVCGRMCMLGESRSNCSCSSGCGLVNWIWWFCLVVYTYFW